MYWIGRVTKADDGSVRTIIQSRGIGGQVTWKRIAQPGGTVVSMASRDNELAVLLDGGDWMLVWDGGSSSGELPEDGAKLIKLAGSKQTLWAIAAAGQGRAPSTSATTQAATTLPVGTRSLYRLDRGQWQWVAPLPNASADAIDLALAADDETPKLALLSPDHQVLVFAFDTSKQSWESGGALDAGASATRVRFLTDLGTQTLWAGDDRGTGAIFLRKPDWSPPIPLAIGPQSGPVAAADITVAGQSIRLVLLVQGSDKLVEYSFDKDGTARGSSVDVQMPRSASGDARAYEWLHLLALALLAMVLFNSLRAPRTIVDPETLEEAGIELAPLGRRFLAALVDAAPIVVTGLVLMAQFQGENWEAAETFLMANKLPRYIAIAAYILHTTLTETFWGWTIGKRVFGLQVSHLDGSAPSRAALFWRNILRIVDAATVASALWVFISPLRQRVGDVAAETIVILRRRAESVSDQPAETREKVESSTGTEDSDRSG
jgi:uncharacterized RDD family membrane protein YckC